MNKTSKIYIAGHRGLVGSALLGELSNAGFDNLCYATHSQLDLLDGNETDYFFKYNKPEYVFLAAAVVGGIYANMTYPAQFIESNLGIQTNVIRSCYKHGVKKLLFLGSSCIYPKDACTETHNIVEDDLLSGPLEITNRPYAIAKIAGIEMVRSYNAELNTNYICLMPSNLYGKNDSYDPKNSHMIPALIRKFHEAKVNDTTVELWGSGKPRREVLHADDLANAAVFLMNNYNATKDDCIINVGSGKDYSIAELAQIVAKIVGYDGSIIWNSEMPDGTMRKLMDNSKINKLGWSPKIGIEEGLRMVYRGYLQFNLDR